MTIKDIAKMCGVSVSTVSRVLNNHPDVSESVRKNVLEAVAAAHYVPNNSARDLVRTPEDSIGLIVRGAENPFYSVIINAIEKECDQQGFTLVLNQIQEQEDEVLAAAALARSKKLTGLILLGGCFDYTPEQTAAIPVPYVCCTFTNQFGSVDDAAYDSVSIDDEEEARRAVSYLIERGHRRIAILLNATDDHSISELRYRGYLKALQEAGIEADPDLVQETVQYSMHAAYDGVKQLLNRTRDFSAVFAIADSMAIATIKALYEAGIRVPEECSVIAIDGLETSVYTIPTLTTLEQPREEMGRQAVQSLVRLIRGKKKPKHLRMEAQLREGASVAPN